MSYMRSRTTSVTCDIRLLSTSQSDSPELVRSRISGKFCRLNIFMVELCFSKLKGHVRHFAKIYKVDTYSCYPF